MKLGQVGMGELPLVGTGHPVVGGSPSAPVGHGEIQWGVPHQVALTSLIQNEAAEASWDLELAFLVSTALAVSLEIP